MRFSEKRKKRYADKIKAVCLVPVYHMESQPEVTLAHLMFDTSELRRIDHDVLTEAMFNKAVDLYPFAIVDKCVRYTDTERKTAIIPVYLPLSPSLHLAEVKKDEKNG